MFTYRSHKSGIRTKADLARVNPMLAGIKPIAQGQVFYPKQVYHQSAGDLDLVIREIAAIIHPEPFPPRKLSYFVQLEDD